MSGRRKVPCILCGAPCTNKTCAVCHHKDKYASLSIAKCRKRRYQRIRVVEE